MSDPSPTPPPIPRLPPALPSAPAAAPPVISPPPRKKTVFSWPVKIILAVTILATGFVGLRVVQVALYFKNHPRSTVPGEAAFDSANHQILAYHGTAAFGNSPEAIALAGDFSKNMKILRESLFTAGKKGALSVAKGEFLTYCQWNGDSCVFLVHVPELRRFTKDAKKSIAALAWSNAQSVLKDSKQPPPKTVIVGVRGAILYDVIYIGDFVADPKNNEDGIQTRADAFREKDLLYPYFADKTAPAAPSQP